MTKRIPALLLVSALVQVLASSTPLVAEEAAPELPGLEDVRDVDLPALLAAGGRCVTADAWGDGERRHPGKERELRLDAEIQIPVAFHVIYQEIYSSGTWKKVGNVSSTRIASQIQVLNDAFAGTGIRFVLRSVDRRRNNTWFAMTMGSAAERDAKAALAIDPAHVLNVYSAGLASSALGWAYYPWAFPEGNWMHGLVIQHGTIPGGKLLPYHLGDTAVHELGHYFGLYHTFQGGCTTGDQVADTPSEASPAYGCPINRDTCPSPGLDPTQNFMDYTDDACMFQFTPGQVSRMSWALPTYKPGFLAPALLVQSSDPTAGAVGEGPTLVARPNPFNPTTALSFRLPQAGPVSLAVFDVAGRRVRSLYEGALPAGEHQFVLEARDLSSGVYLAVLQAGETSTRHRLVLVK